MTRDDALHLIFDIIEEVMGIPTDELTEATNLQEDHDVDSLQLLDMITVCEERFGMSLPDDDLERLVTVGDAVDLVVEYAARLDRRR